MMDEYLFWFAVGVFAGALHAWMLWKMSQPPFHLSAWHLPRFLVVGAILVLSAVNGGLIPAIAGWMAAFAFAIGVTRIAGTR